MISLSALVPQVSALQNQTPFASAPVEVVDVFVNLLLAAALGWLLALVYVRCGSSLSNRRTFASNFVLLAMTTMLIITVVKSSLALSLGLVGALSIVRFRAAIKEPEELAYLFLTIAIGLGLGADQRWITLVAFAVIVTVIVLRRLFRDDRASRDFCLVVTSAGEARIGLPDIVAVLEEHSRSLDLKRCDDGPDTLEASFLVEFADLAALERSKAELRSRDPQLGISFLDNKGIL